MDPPDESGRFAQGKTAAILQCCVSFGCCRFHDALANEHRSAEDKSVRYVAQENIVALPEMPTRELTELAGRYFKRWDNEEKTFVSNICEEYPHD